MRPEGIEPPAYRFEACRSIHLSYGRMPLPIKYLASSGLIVLFFIPQDFPQVPNALNPLHNLAKVTVVGKHVGTFVRLVHSSFSGV